MAIGKYRNLKILVVTFLFLIISILTVSHEAYPRNWDWDQNHDCVEGEGGISGWGRWDYDGKMKGDYSSKDCCELLCKICPVYANTGQYQKTFTDLRVPGIGPALNITRTYNSQEWASSLLGHGWVFNFGRRLIITRNKAGEKVVGVLLEAGEKNFFKEYSDGTLERLTDYGVTYDLIKNSDNTYTIVSRNGTWYELREDGKIAKIIDRNQNELVFSYNSVGCLSRITNASANYVDFQLGVNGKIASVSDNLGRTVTYGYDENGNLTSVTDPMGNTTQYVYNSNNLLAQIIDARGNVVESATYDNNQPPRVSTFVEKGETYTIAYFDGRTEKTDSQGNKWTYYFNDVGVIEKVVDPLGNETNRQLNKITAQSVDWEDDLNGNRTSYTYGGDGNIASKTDPLGNTWTYSYIAGADLLETGTNSLGVVTKYEYDGNGNETAIIRDFGGSLENRSSYTYDNQGNQTSVTDPLNHTTTYEYDSNGNLIKMTGPLGNVTAYTYDSRGNKLTETDTNGNTTTYTYDLMDKLVSITDTLGNITTYTYDVNGKQTSVTDANGNISTFAYDAYNRVVQEIDPLGNTTSYTYDSRDNRISMTNANENTTTYTYDILNRMMRETNALGGQTNYTYDAVENILTVTDANGNKTTFTYDANNRKISETNAVGETTSYSYDANGNQITMTLPNSNTITRTYDALERLVSVADSLGQISGYTYNLAESILTESDALGNLISYTYDQNNRVIQQTDSMGNSTNYTYDSLGNLITITDREGNSVSYSYDAFKRKVSSVDQSGNTTTFSYDTVGNLLSITDANDNVTSYTCDAGNRLIQETYADGTTRIFTYDAVGNLITRTDQKDQVTTYVYDKLNRKIKVDYPGSNDNEYTYDAINNLLTADNQNTTIPFAYDSVHRLTQSIQNGQTVSYSYDIPNNTRTITYPNGKVVKEVRNQRASLVRVENTSSQAIVQYTYDGADKLQTKAYLNGITTNFTHNANSWITTLNYNDGASQIIGFQYGFDQEGNRLYANKLHDPSNSEQYIYDAKYRLIQFKGGTLDGDGNVTVPVTQTAYNLDALGNWVSKTTEGVTENRTHNEMNEIVDIDGTSHVYDDNGNLVDDGTNTYEYDYENRLLRVTRKSDTTILGEYKYDALGRRGEKQASEITTTYYYDNYRVIEEQVGGITEATYVYGNIIDEVVTMARDGQTYYYHSNSLGSIVALTDTSGSIIEQYSYDVFGKPSIFNGSGSLLSDSAVGNPYLFTGRCFDKESGLQYNRNRYFSYELGRWMTQDPIGYINSMNLYEYSINNPVNYTDPLGLTTIGQILDEFFSWFNRRPDLWVMGPNDSYTRIVRNWAPVQGNIARLKRAVAADPEDWKQNHITSSSWIPTMSYSPDPKNGWNSLVRSPAGTDPATAKRNFILYQLTGIQTEELHTSAIGSFRIIATADKVDECQAKLNIWMYNEMSRRSFGSSANHPLFRFRPMASQFMWWNWKEEFMFDAQGNITDIPGGGGGW